MIPAWSWDKSQIPAQRGEKLGISECSNRTSQAGSRMPGAGNCGKSREWEREFFHAVDFCVLFPIPSLHAEKERG